MTVSDATNVCNTIVPSPWSFSMLAFVFFAREREKGGNRAREEKQILYFRG